jgi:carboxypeptidase family protein
MPERGGHGVPRQQKMFPRLVTLFFCFALSVQAQTPSPKATDEPTRGTISGKVVNESGQPLAGASAFVRSVNSPGTSRMMTTDAEGYFQANNLEPGLYTVIANAPAYTSAPGDPTSPTYYRIGDSVNVQLIRGGVITGTVTNALGEPVIGVRVRAIMVRNTKGQPPGPVFFGIMEQSTDDRGIYRIYGLAPGTYLVSAGGTNIAQPFLFNPYDTDAPTYAPSSTRDDAAEVSVRSGEESSVDIRYRSEAGHTVSGTVKVSGTTTGATITLAPVGGVAMPVGTTFQGPGSRGFAFNGISDGEYDLFAQEFIQSQTPTMPVVMLSDPKRITVKGSNVGGIELIPKPLSSVSGRLVLEPSKLPECEGKRPPLFAETIIRFQRPEKDSDNPAYSRTFGNAGSPDANGAFVLRNISPGKYRFEPRFYARYWFLQSVTIGAAPATTAKAQTSRVNAAANWTVVKPGDQINSLTITLAEGAASIRGKFVSSETSSGVVLYLVPSEPDKADDVLRFFVTDIAADGTFALNNLPPGRYWLLMQTNVDAQISNVTKLRLPEAATARTKLRRSAETQKTEIQLKPCQNLTDYQLSAK